MKTEEIEALIFTHEHAAVLGERQGPSHAKAAKFHRDSAAALRFLLKEREQLREASQRVLDGLDARIDNAPGDAVPVFDGIAELHSALASPQRQGDRPELPNDLRSRETKTGENP